MFFKELAASISVLVSLIAVPALVAGYHERVVLGGYEDGVEVYTLTAIAKNGKWTLETVNSGNYWRKDFAGAVLYLEEGRNVVLRLQSADVHHRFYVPELGIGPIEIEPGHTETTLIEAPRAGKYRYYCTAICGDCHFYMQGWIIVTAKGEVPEDPDSDGCAHEVAEPQGNDPLSRGAYLYGTLGCTSCHGIGGRGGVTNPNYIKATIPAHNTLAEKFFLEDQEDTQDFIEYLVARARGEEAEEPDLPRARIVMSQYQAAKDLILHGKECAKLDSNGPEPPLQMPRWSVLLTEDDVDSIIAHLLTLYPWDDEEE